MLKVSLDLDFTKPGTTGYRKLALGDPLPIVVKVEHDGSDGSTLTTFDSLVVQILFNDTKDGRDILTISPVECPAAGDLANNSDDTCCAGCGESGTGGTANDPDGPYSNETQLQLIDAQGSPPEPYRSMTGLAGLRDLASPITLTAGQLRDVAGRRAATGMPTLSPGITNVVAMGYAFNGSTPVPIRFLPSRVEVVDQ